MNNVNVIEPTLINFLLIISPYIFGFSMLYYTEKIEMSIFIFLISVPAAYSLIYYLNDIPF